MKRIISIALLGVFLLTSCSSSSREVTEVPSKVDASVPVETQATETTEEESTETEEVNEARETLKNLMVLGARADGDEITDEFAYCVIDAMKEGTGLEYDVLFSELIADEEFIEEGEIGIMLLTCFAEFGDQIEDFFEDEEDDNNWDESQEAGWTTEEEAQFNAGCIVALTGEDAFPEVGALNFEEAATSCECLFNELKNDVTGFEFLYLMNDDEQLALAALHIEKCYFQT